MASKYIFILFFINYFSIILCRKHHLILNDEKRRDIEITNFGLLQGGMMSINISNLSFPAPVSPIPKTTLIGFTLDMSGSYESASYAEDHTNGNCVLKPGSVGKNDSVATVYLTFNFTTKSLEVNRWGTKLRNLKIVPMNGAKDMCMEELAPSPPNKPPGGENKPPGMESNPSNGEEQSPDGEQNLSRRRRQEHSETNLNESDQKNKGASGPQDKTAPGDTGPVPPEDKSAGDPGNTNLDAGNADEATGGGTGPNSDDVSLENHGAVPPGDESGPRPVDEEKAKSSPTTANPQSHVIMLPTDMKRIDNIMYINTSFVVCIRNKSEQGLYSFFYHHCSSIHKEPVNLSVSIVEKNVGPNYLSAGDIPLPTLYATMSLLFLCSAIYWIYYLCQQEVVFKIHYFMFFLALLKALSLMFHAVDYHYIAHDGRPMQAFEILFYITYLTKGALLFGTIVLIGSGWAFIKPILSDQDKKIFWIVIPLQILANVAYIITDTSEEGEAQYSMWKVMFVTVDIICCGAILYPVIWSIRHLQDAAQTDGKAAISLVKLKLFRSYYVLVVCYIYFSRIVVYILKVTMPFQFMWLDEFFFELATYVFYVVTAYKFRPGTDNPYLQLPSDDEDDDEIEMDEVLTETGLSEGLKRNVGNTATSRVKQRETNHSA